MPPYRQPTKPTKKKPKKTRPAQTKLNALLLESLESRRIDREHDIHEAQEALARLDQAIAIVKRADTEIDNEVLEDIANAL